MEQTRMFWSDRMQDYLDCIYKTRGQLNKLDTVRYYFSYLNENEKQRWDIFHDGNYEEFFYTES
ncbi:hypothetical protein [Enterococcus sp. HMSC076E04]|uniref:hypothetical protein n=1 Tax=Enterococcus sp. HMSC076E04 TaxID=1739465 RepID=UPI0008A22F34|nr:hypothetical protein [Enterococcus sp. HMSC076E04]OFQ02055.1 hypothetical protein HMPREF2961_00280 [Enterococcus sp. HMSC076E04]